MEFNAILLALAGIFVLLLVGGIIGVGLQNIANEQERIAHALEQANKHNGVPSS